MQCCKGATPSNSPFGACRSLFGEHSSSSTAPPSYYEYSWSSPSPHPTVSRLVGVWQFASTSTTFPTLEQIANFSVLLSNNESVCLNKKKITQSEDQPRAFLYLYSNTTSFALYIPFFASLAFFLSHPTINYFPNLFDHPRLT